MKMEPAIAILGTFDSKGEEHLFLRGRINERGFRTLTINVGTGCAPTVLPDVDLFKEVKSQFNGKADSRDRAIQLVMEKGRCLIKDLHDQGKIGGIISAGGGTGTHIATGIMRVLPLGVPKVMVSTVASRDMSGIVGTKDITMMHSVADILGVNSILGGILDRAAGAVCGMMEGAWNQTQSRKRIALTMFGFITKAAEAVRDCLEAMEYEVIAFHANGTGGMAMEELAREGRFDGILDLATHELADELKQGYCRGIGPERLEPVPGIFTPRLVVPGGLDCAVLEFTRQNVPDTFRDRKIFFYDFRSAIRLSPEESRVLAEQIADKLNQHPASSRLLIPMKGWSEADCEGGPLYEPSTSMEFLLRLKREIDPAIRIHEEALHINDLTFARVASNMMHDMIRRDSC